MTKLPSYQAEIAANPFKAFIEIPKNSRYQFLLDDAQYFVAGFALAITIVGIPFAFQSFKLGILMLAPFGSHAVKKEGGIGCLWSIMNIIWFFVGGIWITISHFLFGVLFYITIIGIPFGQQHFKLARLALTPFGKEII